MVGEYEGVEVCAIGASSEVVFCALVLCASCGQGIEERSVAFSRDAGGSLTAGVVESSCSVSQTPAASVCRRVFDSFVSLNVYSRILNAQDSIEAVHAGLSIVTFLRLGWLSRRSADETILL